MKNWTHNKTKKQVKDRMKELSEKVGEKRRLAFKRLKLTEDIEQDLGIKFEKLVEIWNKVKNDKLTVEVIRNIIES